MMLGRTGVFQAGLWNRLRVLVLGVAVVVTTNALLLPAAPANADPSHPKPVVVDAETLTKQQLTDQVKAADALRAALMKSSAEVAATSSRLDRISAQANTLLAQLSAARIAQAKALTEAAAQKAHLRQLGLEVVGASDALGRLASDAYIRGGGPLGDITAILEALSAPSADQNNDTMATVQYLLDGRARLFDRLKSLRSEQVTTSAKAEAASVKASLAATTAATAKSKLDTVIVQQRAALEGFRAARASQVGSAASVRGTLLRSEDPLARAADKRLAEALQGQDFKLLMDSSSSCGKDPGTYPNGRLPASALCPLYANPDQSLSRDAAMAFNAMSNEYQKETGSALCVADSYRSYPEQVAIKLERPGLAATPGTSQHGLGLAVDLCGGVQDFSAPAHLWMQHHAPLYGWFHPAWAEPSGVLPEPWHWEFAS
ncbi:MAG: M15 family metallopeptidase [Dermatophilaceae bacterium]